MPGKWYPGTFDQHELDDITFGRKDITPKLNDFDFDGLRKQGQVTQGTSLVTGSRLA